MAQALPPGGRVVTFEKDLTWVLVAKRFMWQASQGSRNAGLAEKIGDRVRPLPQPCPLHQAPLRPTYTWRCHLCAAPSHLYAFYLGRGPHPTSHLFCKPTCTCVCRPACTPLLALAFPVHCQSTAFTARSAVTGPPCAHPQVEVRWGDAREQLPKLFASAGRPIDLLFLDGVPKEYLEYLKAAEPYLAPGALVVADNAGVFANGGLKPYLEYVRDPNGPYRSELVSCKLEWRDDVDDGIEVSSYVGKGGATWGSAEAVGAAGVGSG